MLFYYIKFSALFRFSAIVFGDYMEKLIKIDQVDLMNASILPFFLVGVC